MCVEQTFSLSVVWELERERESWVYEGSWMCEEQAFLLSVVWE